MSGLDQHFGTDASLEPAAHSTAFLERNAGRERGASATPPLRGTETRWFPPRKRRMPAPFGKARRIP